MINRASLNNFYRLVFYRYVRIKGYYTDRVCKIIVLFFIIYFEILLIKQDYSSNQHDTKYKLDLGDVWTQADIKGQLSVHFYSYNIFCLTHAI